MQYPTFKFLSYKNGVFSVDEKALIDFIKENTYGKITEKSQENYLKPILSATIDTKQVEFNKLETDFLKDLYSIEYDVIEPQELFLWKRLTLQELIAICKTDSALARLVEVEIRLGDIFIYEVENDDADYYILIKLF